MNLKLAIDQFSDWRSIKVKDGTMKGYDNTLRYFCLFLRNPEIEEITVQNVTEFLKLTLDVGWKHNSLIPKATALRKFFEFYRLQGYRVLNEELIPIPEKEYNPPRVATESEYYQLLKTIPKNNDPRHIRNRAMVQMFWDTGARNGEICSLDVEDLDLDNQKALIRTEKAKVRRPFREIFWSKQTNLSIVSWIRKRELLTKKNNFCDSQALFLCCSGSKIGQRFSNKGVGEMLRRYSHKANFDFVVNAHSFRHHKGHFIIKAGGSSADVSNILGHSSLLSSQVYTMMTDNELKERAFKFMN